MESQPQNSGLILKTFFHVCGITQSIYHIPFVFSITDCVSFFVSSCFSSPEPKTSCELLHSLDVCRPSSTNSSKDISS